MAVNAGDVGKGAVTGAVLGSALGPEGTVAGAVIGGGYEALSGALSGPSLPASNANNFTLGTNQGTIAQPGYALAQGYSGQGAVYRQQAGNRYAQAGNAFAAGNAAQARGPGQVSMDPYDRQRQLAALGGLNANAAQFQQMGTAPQGPSVAAAQLQQGQDAAMQQSLAMARSGRTIGGGAAAMQQAQFQNAQTEQATNQQAVAARLQEQQQYHQQQLAALGAAQQGYGAAAGQANAINQANVGVQAQNAGLALQQQGVNNQTTATYGQIGQGLNSTALGQGQLGQTYDQLGLSTLQDSLAASEQYQNSINGNAVNQAGIDQANRNSNQAMLASGLGAAATYYGGAGGGGTASDRDVKQNIMPAGGMPDSMPLESRAGQPLGAQQPAFNGAQLSPEQQATQQRLQNPTAPQQPITNPYNGMTQFGLSGQQQQMQLGDMYGRDHRAQAWAQMSQAAAAHQASMTQGSQMQQSAPPPPPVNNWQGDNGRVSDVSAKQDIKPADSEPWYKSWGATLRALGGGDQPNAAPAAPPAMVRDPHNPSQMISPYASIGDASRGAHGAPPTPDYGLDYSPPPPQPMFAPGTTPPDTWGGAPSSPDRPAIDLRPAAPYSYEYKDPDRHGQGRFFGPMAQDLEKTPAGASVVKRAPDGTKIVDTSRLALVNTGAISDLQRQIAALGGGPQLGRGPTPYPQLQEPGPN